MSAGIGILTLGLIAAEALGARVMAARPTEEPTATTETIGVGLQTLTPFVAHSLGLDPDTKGAVVTEVLDSSPAAQSGLETGDIILEIDQKPVSSAAQAVRQLGDRKSHLLRVRNARGSRVLTLPAS